MPKLLYDEIGGYRALPLMEDVDIARRLERRRIVMLRARAMTERDRFQRDGYVRRSARNLTCLALYFLRVPTPSSPLLRVSVRAAVPIINSRESGGCLGRRRLLMRELRAS